MMADKDLMEFPPDKDPMALAAYKEQEKMIRDIAKKAAIENMVVKNHNIPYAGDDVSQLRMTSTVALANWKYNQAIGKMFVAASDKLPEGEHKSVMLTLGTMMNDTYNMVYKDTKIGWKGADKKIHKVEVESVSEALYKTMVNLATLYKEEK